MDHPNSLVAALERHGMPKVRAAFEAAKKATGETYDRTTLNRWMTGSVPTKASFIRQLADELADDEVFDSWDRLRNRQSPSQARSIISRYQRLNDGEKDWVFHEIRAAYLASFPAVHSRMTWRAEINDPPNPDDDHLIVRVENTWTGAIPATAEVQIVSDHEELGDAYANPDCIFREKLDFDSKQLAGLLGTMPDPILAINPLDSSAPRGAHYVGQPTEPGLFRFENPAAAVAKVQFTVSYPYPRGQGVFFIRLGRYQVPDSFDVSLRLNSRSASSPRAFPFLPPGRQREFSEAYPGPDELFLTVGTDNTVYGEGDGVVLYWTES